MTKFLLAEYCRDAFKIFSKNDNLAELARLTEKSFTRDRNLTCERLFMMIVSGIRLSLQLAADEFFDFIGKKEAKVSKQAVSKARTNLNPNVIKDLFMYTAEGFCKCDDIELWKNKYRLCAIDGSDIALDNANNLYEHFGSCRKDKKATTAMLSIAFDPLNNFILDASLDPYKMDERSAAKAHISAMSKLSLPEGVHNLIIMDRGYPSREFFAELIDASQKFIMRVRRKFNVEFDAVESDENISFVVNSEVYSVRILKVTLETGEIETLVTNLAQDELATEEAGELYFERWGIETKYDSLKNKLQFGNFSGRRVITVMQDFWATMYLANLMAALEIQTDAVIAARIEGKENKYEQKTNENRLIRKFRNVFFDCLLEPDISKRDALFSELIADIAKYGVEVKPNRIVKRKTPRNMKYHDRRKSVI